jgi:hypothetical protein
MVRPYSYYKKVLNQKKKKPKLFVMKPKFKFEYTFAGVGDDMLLDCLRPLYCSFAMGTVAATEGEQALQKLRGKEVYVHVSSQELSR